MAIARPLSLQPRLILADKVFSLLREFNRDHDSACLLVTHDPRLAPRCDRTIELVNGHVLAHSECLPPSR